MTARTSSGPPASPAARPRVARSRSAARRSGSTSTSNRKPSTRTSRITEPAVVRRERSRTTAVRPPPSSRTWRPPPRSRSVASTGAPSTTACLCARTAPDAWGRRRGASRGSRTRDLGSGSDACSAARSPAAPRDGAGRLRAADPDRRGRSAAGRPAAPSAGPSVDASRPSVAPPTGGRRSGRRRGPAPSPCRWRSPVRRRSGRPAHRVRVTAGRAGSLAASPAASSALATARPDARPRHPSARPTQPVDRSAARNDSLRATKRWNGSVVWTPPISVSSIARRRRSIAASRSEPWTISFAMRLSYSGGTRSPASIAVSTRTPGPGRHHPPADATRRRREVAATDPRR